MVGLWENGQFSQHIYYNFICMYIVESGSTQIKRSCLWCITGSEDQRRMLTSFKSFQLLSTFSDGEQWRVLFFFWEGEGGDG